MTNFPSPAETNNQAPAADSAAPGLARLFEEHNAMLINLLRCKLHSEQEARDVAQEAYVRLLQLDKPGTISYLRAYLFRTALNCATDGIRMQVVGRLAQPAPSLEGGVDEISPERSAVAADELDAVRRAMAKLPVKSREAFRLHSFGELDLAQIAARMQISERSVRNYIADALVCCREAI